MIRSLSVRRVPRSLAVVLSIALAAVALPVLAGSASAAVQTFEVEGNLLVDTPGNLDWANAIAYSDVINDNAGGDPTVYSTSSKEGDPVSTWTLGSPGTAPPKADIGNVYKYIRSADSGDIELFFGWDRLSGQGTLYYYLELNKLPNSPSYRPNRSDGDARFTLEDKGNGVIALGRTDIWQSGAWVQAPATVGFEGRVNTAEVPLPTGWNSPAEKKDTDNSIPQEQFFETYFNLTDLIGLVPGCPPALGTLNFRSSTGETGSEAGENLKDFIAPLALDAPTTCGTLEIVKKTTPATTGVGFEFANTVSSPPDGIKVPAYTGPITLTTGAGGTVSTSYTVAPGLYTFQEALKDGWDLTNLVCVDPTSNSPVNLGTRSATFNVASNEKVTCTYTNTKRAKLTVVKATRPAGVTDSFGFSSPTPAIGSFSLLDTQSNTTQNLLPNQTYSVTETLTDPQKTAGWFIESAVCKNTGTDTVVATGDNATGLTSVTLAPGADVTCTYTNTKKGVIEVEKQTDPASTTPAFPFTTTVPNWTVGGDGTLVDNEVDSEQVVPGTYTVTESGTSGWNLTGILCTDPTGNSSGSTATGIATYIVAPGETVRCVYTNTKQGVITVEKQTLPDGSTQDFTFTPSFTIAPGADNILRDGQSFSSVGLAPGQYTVSETVPAGWKALTQADIVCQITAANGTTTSTSGNGAVIIDLKAGAGVNCVFTNTQKARVIVDKVTNPAGSAQTFPLTGSGLPGLPTSISDATSYDSGLIDPGTAFSVTETATDGWDLTSAVCKVGNTVVGTVNGATVGYTPKPGETVTCTYVNTQQAKVVIVKKTDPASQGGTFDFASTVPGFGPKVTITVPNNTPAGVSSTSPLVSVAPGGSAFTVSETAPAGWNLLSLVCVDPDGGTTVSPPSPASGTATIDLDPGETVTCTFTNTKLGSLTIGKLTFPPGDPTTFTFDSSVPSLNGAVLADQQSKKSDPLVAGTYTFQERPTAGWYQDAVVCRDTDAAPGQQVVFSDFTDYDTPPLVSIDLGKAQNITCTVTNVKYATLIVDKVTNPAGATDLFPFTANGGPSAISEVFNLADTTPVKSIKVKPVLNPSVPGYVVAEGTLPPDWAYGTQTCDNGNAVGDVRPAAGATVICTFNNVRSGRDLTVAKTASPTYTRTYTWDITKTSNATYNLLAGQNVVHPYAVGVTQTFVDSAWKVTGTITVTNPNTYAVTNVAVADTINNGGVCTVATPLIASIPASGNSGPIGYECTYAAAPNPASGTNTATATWDKVANFTPTGTASGTAPAVFAGPTTEIQPTVTVDDDNVVGENWTANRANASWDYTKDFACSTNLADYTDGKYSYTVVNTATIVETKDTAQATVTVNCSTAVVSKTAAGTYDERHEWDVVKTVDPASQDQFAGEDGDYTWTVVVTEDTIEEAFAVTGSISVRNPSTTAAMTATVTDKLDDGTVADVTGGTGTGVVWTDATSTVTVPAGVIASCAYTAAPTTKTATKNTVTVTVGGVVSTADAPVAWTPNVIRGEVTLDDNQNPDLPDTITEGGTWTYDDFETCSTDSAKYGSDGTYTISDENTATIREGDELLDSSTATTVVNCFAPVVSKTTVEDFTRTWNWDIVKEKDATYNLVAGDSVTHPYTVDVTPTPVDNFWTVSGEITVANSHPTQAMTLTGVTDLVKGLTGDITATVTCSSLVVPAGGSLKCSYTTGPKDSPGANPFGNVNTATADFAGTGWTGTAPVAFPAKPTTEIDPVVTVDDDLFGPLEEPTTDRTEAAWEYSTEYACPAPGSAEYGDTGSYSYTVVNTASVFAAQPQQEEDVRLAAAAAALDSDIATVTVNCADGDLVIVKSNTPTGLVPLGSTVTYTLKVGALGTLDQPGVVVTDYIPGYDPAVTGSGLMTYVANSATCDTGAFPCAVAYDATAKKLTWNIDQINAGETRTLTFQATVDRTQPSIPPLQSGTVTLKNVAAATSPTEGTVKSNEVQNTANIVIAVLPEVIVKTGVGAPIGPLALVGVVLVGMGVVFSATARRREEDPLIEG